MVQKSESRDLDKVIVRLPDGMRDRLKAMAKDNNRTLNAQIVYMLEYAIDDMHMAASLNPEDRQKQIPSEFFRDMIRQNIAVLQQVIGDYENPESAVNEYERAKLAKRTGQKQDPNSTPINRPRKMKGSLFKDDK